MSTVIVNVKVDPKVKKQAQKVAKDLGFSLSGLVNAYLKQLVRTKSVAFSAISEEPSDYLIQALKESEEDIKAGRVSASFSNADDAIAYLDALIDDKKKLRKN